METLKIKPVENFPFGFALVALCCLKFRSQWRNYLEGMAGDYLLDSKRLTQLPLGLALSIFKGINVSIPSTKVMLHNIRYFGKDPKKIRGFVEYKYFG